MVIRCYDSWRPVLIRPDRGHVSYTTREYCLSNHFFSDFGAEAQRPERSEGAPRQRRELCRSGKIAEKIAAGGLPGVSGIPQATCCPRLRGDVRCCSSPSTRPSRCGRPPGRPVRAAGRTRACRCARSAP